MTGTSKGLITEDLEFTLLCIHYLDIFLSPILVQKGVLTYPQDADGVTDLSLEGSTSLHPLYYHYTSTRPILYKLLPLSCRETFCVRVSYFIYALVQGFLQEATIQQGTREHGVNIYDATQRTRRYIDKYPPPLPQAHMPQAVIGQQAGDGDLLGDIQLPTPCYMDETLMRALWQTLGVGSYTCSLCCTSHRHFSTFYPQLEGVITITLKKNENIPGQISIQVEP